MNDRLPPPLPNSDMKPTKNCPFCGESILAAAIRCRYCHSDLSSPPVAAAPAPPSASSSEVTVNRVPTTYDEVPWFRKNWFAFVCFFCCGPALLLIVLTGDIYYEKHGRLVTYGMGSRIFLGLLGGVSLLTSVAAIPQLLSPSIPACNAPEVRSLVQQLVVPSELTATGIPIVLNSYGEVAAETTADRRVCRVKVQVTGTELWKTFSVELHSDNQIFVQIRPGL